MTLEDGATLTIDPGAVIKFGRSEDGTDLGGLNVKGTLQAVGAEKDSIVFTSVYDDSYGGDTNGDGNSTSASSGDWDRIHFRPGSSGHLAYTLVQHGGAVQNGGAEGGGMVDLDRASVEVTDSRLGHSWPFPAVEVKGGEEGTPQVTGNTIAQNRNYGLEADGGEPLVEDNKVASNGDTGIRSYEGQAVIRDNEITGNRGNAVAVRLPSAPTDAVLLNVKFRGEATRRTESGSSTRRSKCEAVSAWQRR